MLSRQTRSLLLRVPARKNNKRMFAADVRGYAQAAAVQDTKPPIAIFGLDGTYATALVRLNRYLLR